MKKIIVLGSLVTILFTACSKEQKCIKGKIVAMGPCSKMWVVQIIEGPRIGERWQEYDNIIELYNVPQDKVGGDEIYFAYRDKREGDDKGVCLPIVPEPNYSNVEKTLVSLSDNECQ